MSAPIALLRELSHSHEKMAAMAKTLDWDGVTNEWQAVQEKFSSLMKTQLTTLNAEEREEARQQVENLIVLQKEISAQVKPWMEQTKPMLDIFERFPLSSE